MPKYKYLSRLLKTATKRFFADNYLYEASALAFTTLLTLVPLLSILIYVLSIFPFFDKLFMLAKHYIFTNFVPTSGTVIEQYLEEFSQQATVLPTTSMLFLLFSIIMLISLVKNIINTIWGSPRYRNTLLSILHFLAILVMPVLIAISIYITNGVVGFYWITHTADILGLQLLLSGLLVFFTETLSFTLLYMVMPSCPVKLKDGLMGGLVATVLFEIAKTGFVFYIQFFPSYQLIYGALAIVPIFLLWLYISWAIVILGALISHTSHRLEK